MIDGSSIAVYSELVFLKIMLIGLIEFKTLIQFFFCCIIIDPNFLNVAVYYSINKTWLNIIYVKSEENILRLVINWFIFKFIYLFIYSILWCFISYNKCLKLFCYSV